LICVSLIGSDLQVERVFVCVCNLDMCELDWE
jgi:hypothetical protein